MTMRKEWCILWSKGSSWHSFVYPSASVRAIWLRCGLKWRDFCINGKALTQKVSPFLRLPKGVTEHEAGKTGLGKIPAYFAANIFALPLIARLEGRRLHRRSVKARLSESVSANHGRAQYTGVRLERRADGLYAAPVRTKSGLITNLAGTDGYFCIDRDCEGLPAGAEVSVIFGE